MDQFDVVVIGAGAAGMMCAAEAGKRGRSVLVVDHAAKPGEKIRISGGGRCNFTNLNAGPANFISQNPSFAISALRRYTQRDFIALVERHGIAYHEKTLGQLFCDGSSKQVVELLLNEQHPAATLTGSGRAHQAGGTGAEDDDVIRGGHGKRLLSIGLRRVPSLERPLCLPASSLKGGTTTPPSR